jgi:hypothetical protein
MLKDLNVDQAYFIATRAEIACKQCDAVLGNVAEDDLGGSKAGRDERNPTAENWLRLASI